MNKAHFILHDGAWERAQCPLETETPGRASIVISASTTQFRRCAKHLRQFVPASVGDLRVIDFGSAHGHSTAALAKQVKAWTDEENVGKKPPYCGSRDKNASTSSGTSCRHGSVVGLELATDFVRQAREKYPDIRFERVDVLEDQAFVRRLIFEDHARADGPISDAVGAAEAKGSQEAWAGCDGVDVHSGTMRHCNESASTSGACFPVAFVDISGTRELKALCSLLEFLVADCGVTRIFVKSQKMYSELKNLLQSSHVENTTEVTLSSKVPDAHETSVAGATLSKATNATNTNVSASYYWQGFLDAAAKEDVLGRSKFRRNGEIIVDRYPLKRPARYAEQKASAPCSENATSTEAGDEAKNALMEGRKVEICRFHNYDFEVGCKRRALGRCLFDHEHCHWCGQRGHRAVECADFIAASNLARSDCISRAPGDNGIPSSDGTSSTVSPVASSSTASPASTMGESRGVGDDIQPSDDLRNTSSASSPALAKRRRMMEEKSTCVEQGESVATSASSTSKAAKERFLFVVGGRLRGRTLQECEVLALDQPESTWQTHRGSHGACLLADGKTILAAGGGGVDGNLDSAEVLDAGSWLLGLSRSGENQKVSNFSILRQSAGLGDAARLSTPRHAMGCVTVGTRCYAVGGWQYGTVSCGALERLENYDATEPGAGGSAKASDHMKAKKSKGDTDTALHWSLCAPLPTPRRLAGFCGAAGKIFVFGGFVDERRKTDKVECYDTETNAWTERRPLPCGSVCVAAVSINRGDDGSADGERIYIFPFGSGAVYVYDTVLDAYSTLRESSTAGKDPKGQELSCSSRLESASTKDEVVLPLPDWHCFSACAAGKQEIAVCGGATEGRWTGATFLLNVSTGKWTCLADMQQARRRAASVVVTV
ncbi:unnamed protein product [Amoebophrya sp. A25]|nr:unnamed protein product [Amoebophrya sp. A25]|eukprot:GSA25T00005717001.1